MLVLAINVCEHSLYNSSLGFLKAFVKFSRKIVKNNAILVITSKYRYL